MSVSGFAQISTPSRPAQADAIAVVTPVKDEMRLLPAFLAHHRALGLGPFVFIDNASTDGSREFLADQPDCFVYGTEASFRAANYGMDWVNILLAAHAPGQWAVFLDCDELLVFPQMEHTPLPALLREHGNNGAAAFLALMVDMYPLGDWRAATAGVAPISPAIVDHFDSDYIIRTAPCAPWQSQDVRDIEVLGGPRNRLAGTLEQELRQGWVHAKIANQGARIAEATPMGLMPLLARTWPRARLFQHKTPINRITGENTYINNHRSEHTALAPVMLAVLHLKFCADLGRRVDPAFAYANHSQRGLYTFRLLEDLKLLGDRPLAYSGSRRYQNSDSLLNAGLIGEAPARVWSAGLAYHRAGGESAS